MKSLRLFTLLMLTALLVAVLTFTPARAQVDFPPTETHVPLKTSTAVPPSTPAAPPEVDWSDVEIHKKAMKAGYENDVLAFANRNRYIINATLTIETDAIIRAVERVRYTNHSTDTLDTIVFRLYPNAPILAGNMNVTQVSLNDEIVQPVYSELDSVMTLLLSEPLKTGDSAEMIIDFNVVMTKGLDASYGRFGYVQRVVSGTAWYPTLSVYETGKGWWQEQPNPKGDPAYTESGLYDVRLTVPAAVTVAMSGTIVEKRENSDGTITYRDVTGPMRDHAFQASERYVIDTVQVDGTRINLVHYRDPRQPEVDGTEIAGQYAITALHTYNVTFGEYPFAELDIAANPTPTGVEFPGLIQIAAKAWVRGETFLEVVIAHEIGHQWFYSLIGNDQVDHPWLDESLTSYTEIVYMRAAYPTGTKAQEYVDRQQRGFAQYTGKGLPDKPLDAPVASFSNSSYGAIVYTKGALFMVELERQIGQQNVYNSLQAYFSEHKYEVVQPTDLELTVEQTSGKDLTALFDEWVGVSAGEVDAGTTGS